MVKIKGSEDIKFIYLLGDSINNFDDIDNLEIMELNDCYKIYLIKNEFGYITTVPYKSMYHIWQIFSVSVIIMIRILHSGETI